MLRIPAELAAAILCLIAVAAAAILIANRRHIGHLLTDVRQPMPTLIGSVTCPHCGATIRIDVSMLAHLPSEERTLELLDIRAEVLHWHAPKCKAQKLQQQEKEGHTK